jgi:hypothetical protein
VPVTARADGAGPLSDVSAQWWQWVLSLSLKGHPLLEMTPQGLACGQGQRGDNWFLGGLFFSGGTAERQCTLPAGVTLFFPVVNSMGIDTPGICGQVDEQGKPFSLSVADMRAGTAAFIDSVTEATATLDGKPLRLRRLKSTVFSVTLPVDNLFLPFCAPAGFAVPPGVYAPGVDDGYYGVIDKLAPGSHVLKFKSAVPTADFALDITYHLDVMPVKLK